MNLVLQCSNPLGKRVLGQQNKKNLHLGYTGGYLSQQLAATAYKSKEARVYWKRCL
jgi:hypothetical protein